MENKETIQNFCDMVNATEKLTKPWKTFCIWLIAALFLTNAIWGLVHWSQIRYAYLTPTEMSQEQQFDEHNQSQNYSEGATNGN